MRKLDERPLPLSHPHVLSIFLLCKNPTNSTTAAPLPKFEGGAPTQQPQQIQPPQQPPAQPIVQQNSGVPSSPTSGPPPVRVPALGPDKVAEYSALFEKSGAENGVLPGLVAKQIFERARLPIEVLGRIWSLADVNGKGSLDVSEFVIAMHLLASYKSGAMRAVPNTLPQGLLDAASRRPPARLSGPQRPLSAAGQPTQPLPQQFTGQLGGRPQSPIVRQQMGTPLSAQSTGEQWMISPVDKQRFDQVFATVDTTGQGFITGEQAVQFFGNARLPEEVLAQVWDLADINSDGLLNRDEFAVAMYLIRQQRGSRDGRVPQTLPAALVPPSMRKQQMPSQPSTMPVFDDAPITKPKSAVEDLFGLDISENPPQQSQPQPQPSQQIPQSTGGTDAGPFANSRAVPASTASPPPSTFFTPFQPKSGFGQGLVPQSTGFAPQSQQKPSAERDLMDNEDEAPAKINNDAAELGNLSNQVGNLSKQMTDLQGQRGQAEQELAQTANQKRAFQERLTQLRAAYDQEVQQVKSLKEQLASSQAETKRLQQDMAMIEGTHTDLKTQHQQLSSALMADQQENAALKERIRQTNVENEQLKPQLEKLKSDARQQKGLVAINKKQLATNETERERIRAEMAAAQKEAEDAKRETEETARQLEASHKELEQAKSVPIPAPAPREIPREFSPPPQVASPALSTASSNPFFRKPDSGAVFSPPIGSAITSPAPDHERNAAFDSIFGPSFGTAAPAPATSFGRDFDEPEARPETPKVVEPPPSEPANQFESSALPFRSPLLREASTTSSVKVAPPASRLSPAATPRALTPDTSTASPSSHRADDPFASSAVDEQQESVRQTLPRGDTLEKVNSIPGGFPEESRSSTPGFNPAALAVGAGAATIAAGAGLAAAASQSDNDKGKAPAVAGPTDDFDNFFQGPSHKKTLSEQRADFDSAFDSFGADAKPAASTAPQTSNREFPDIHELDDDEESSDESEEDAKGFDDDFGAPAAPTPQSAVAAGKQPEVASAVPSRLQAPPLNSRISNASSLPDFEQQKSPPDYNDAVPEDNPNHFPREYKNLLPEREDPTSPPPTAGGSNINEPNPAGSPPAYGPEVGQSRLSVGETSIPAPNKAGPFDFDSAFQNLGEAPVTAEEEESDSDYDERSPGVLRHQAQSFDFDPTFQSPANSTKTTNTSQKQFSIHDAVTSPSAAPATNGTSSSPISQRNPNAFSSFDEFNSNPFPPSRTGTMQSQSTTAASPARAAPPSHDWDSLFAPLESQGNQATSRPPIISNPTSPSADMGAPLAKVDTARSISQSTQIGDRLAASTTHQEVEDITPPASQQRIPTMKAIPISPVAAAQPSAASSSLAPKAERPKPGRMLTEGTEHDDPILKRLTAMGWSRNESLAALEKFDYNLDKVSRPILPSDILIREDTNVLQAADYLTFKS